jgi:hypothetical protein
MTTKSRSTVAGSVVRSGSVLAAAFALVIGASSYVAAQAPSRPGGGMMGGMMQGYGMMGGCPMMGAGAAAHAEGRVAFLKAELAITDQQKGAWDAYAAAIKKNLAGMESMHETMMKIMQAKTPVERLDAHIAAMDARVASLKEIKPALAALYATLSDDQKKKADDLMTGMGCMM